jgi:hypothetical protein
MWDILWNNKLCKSFTVPRINMKGRMTGRMLWLIVLLILVLLALALFWLVGKQIIERLFLRGPG